MSKRFLASVGIPAAVLAVFVPSAAADQAQAADSARTSTPAAETWTPPRLSDGQPDIQGLWTKNAGQLREIDESVEDPLTVFRLASLPYPTIYNTRNDDDRERQRKAAEARGGRPLGVVDPPGGKLPWRPDADARRREFLKHVGDPPTLDYVESPARCMLHGVPNSGGTGAQIPGIRFLQRPGAVVIFHETNNIVRTIPVDGRPHVGQNIRLYMGDSVGRWEGNTLVVDVTNFNGSPSWWWDRNMPFHSDKLHVVERYTIINADTIDYTATIGDPEEFTRPITVAGYFNRLNEDDYLWVEYACAEGSLALESIMTRPGVSTLRKP